MPRTVKLPSFAASVSLFVSFISSFKESIIFLIAGPISSPSSTIIADTLKFPSEICFITSTSSFLRLSAKLFIILIILPISSSDSDSILYPKCPLLNSESIFSASFSGPVMFETIFKDTKTTIAKPIIVRNIIIDNAVFFDATYACISLSIA